MSRPRKFAKRLTVTSVAIGAIMVASVAFAAWTVSGSGTGSAKATSAVALTATGVTPTADLYPGKTNGDAKLTIDNTNPFDVEVTDIARSGAITSSAGGACNADTGVTFTDQSGLTLSVPAGTSQTFTLSGVVAMDNTSDTACQGATFTIPVSLTAVSV